MLIGTAGHIDHGKTTLVKALTGVDTDRLPQEKARGITLDLGYAYTPLDNDTVLGFVDVPGHEKLIHNMLAGATGIDFALLVVAADDGPMPQTREHLALLDLLGLHRGAVALTKCDRADATQVARVSAEIAALLNPTGLADAPIFPVSASTGDGMPALRQYLTSQALQPQAHPPSGHFRLPIDRCFTLPGLGTAVTGTAFSGQVAVGDSLILAPVGLKVRVRSLHVQDQPATQGEAGQRCALVLAGDINKQDVSRGMWLVAPPAAHPVSRFQAEIRLPVEAPPLKHWTAVHAYWGSDDITGRVALLDQTALTPGGRAFAEILLDRPGLTVRGDRFVLRDASAQHTLAGGMVLDIFPPNRHKRSPERLAVLSALRSADPADSLIRMTEQAPAGIDLTRFAANWNLALEAASTLWEHAHLQVIKVEETQIGFQSTHWSALQSRLRDALEQEHVRAPDMVGVERERLRRMTLATLAPAVFDALLAEGLSRGEIVQTRAWLHLPSHEAKVSSADRDLFGTLSPLLEATPYNPPRVRDVFRATGIAEETVRQLFRRMARTGTLYPVAHDHYFTAAAVAALAQIVSQLCAENGAARAAALRDRIGGGRKVAIQILEFFDRTGYTRRVQDEHRLRPREGMLEWHPSC